ncbi:hypothetical protein F4782DRAFT_497872 [Xylaria castorea]|nr:hypothetical protein F4782DRAFT_497872 [Xylaria castorea]
MALQMEGIRYRCLCTCLGAVLPTCTHVEIGSVASQSYREDIITRPLQKLVDSQLNRYLDSHSPALPHHCIWRSNRLTFRLSMFTSGHTPHINFPSAALPQTIPACVPSNSFSSRPNNIASFVDSSYVYLCLWWLSYPSYPAIHVALLHHLSALGVAGTHLS